MNTAVNSPRTAVRERGLALVSVILLLALAVVGILVWKTFTQLGLVPANAFNAAGVRSKLITTNVVTGLVVFAITGGLGALGYFAFRRSQAAAEVGMCIPLLLATGALGYQAYSYVTRPPAATPTGTTTTGGATTPGGVAIAPAPVQPVAPTTGPRLPAPAPTPTPAPALPAGTGTAVSPAPSPAPISVPPAPAPPPREPTLGERPWQPDPANREPAAVAASLAPDGHPARKVLDEYGRSLSDAVGEVMQMSVDLNRLVTMPLPASKPRLKERVDLAALLKPKAADLERRLRGPHRDLQTALEGAGVDAFSAATVSMRFGEGIDGFARMGAAGDLARAADATMALHQLLIDHAGKWQVNSQGTISTRDRDLNSQIFMKRAAFDREAQRLMESVNTLGAGAKAPEPTKK